MIDYDKLKEAHELAASSERYHFNVMMGFETYIKFYLFSTDAGVVLETFDIEDLITELKELINLPPENETPLKEYVQGGDFSIERWTVSPDNEPIGNHPKMNDNELLEKAAISLQEANACLQLLSYSDSNVSNWVIKITDCFNEIMDIVEDE